MKKRILLLTLAAGMLYVTLQSSSGGVAASGQNRTGAKSSTASCGGSGCHGTGASTTLTTNIRIDSAGGVEVANYVPGMTYTVTVSAAHPATNYGFQFAAVSGSGASQIQAGSFSSLPAQVISRTLSSLNIIEQSSVISSSFSKSFTWTAPATNVGDITMYLTVNAVDGTGGANTNDTSKNMSITLAHRAATSSIEEVEKSIISVFPNPTNGVLNLQLPDAYTNYDVTITDLMGKETYTIKHTANSSRNVTINTEKWPSGMYIINANNHIGSTSIKFIKN